ncbi:hypothetical protein HDZ31DRAFT_67918, partial [Schizophyllum fasciatum]
SLSTKASRKAARKAAKATKKAEKASEKAAKAAKKGKAARRRRSASVADAVELSDRETSEEEEAQADSDGSRGESDESSESEEEEEVNRSNRTTPEDVEDAADVVFTKDIRGRVFGQALCDRINRMPPRERSAFVHRLGNESYAELARQDQIAKSKADLASGGCPDTLEDIMEIARGVITEREADDARRVAKEAEAKASKRNAREARKRAKEDAVAAASQPMNLRRSTRNLKRVQPSDKVVDSNLASSRGANSGFREDTPVSGAAGVSRPQDEGHAGDEEEAREQEEAHEQEAVRDEEEAREQEAVRDEEEAQDEEEARDEEAACDEARTTSEGEDPMVVDEQFAQELELNADARERRDSARGEDVEVDERRDSARLSPQMVEGGHPLSPRGDADRCGPCAPSPANIPPNGVTPGAQAYTPRPSSGNEGAAADSTANGQLPERNRSSERHPPEPILPDKSTRTNKAATHQHLFSKTIPRG